MKHELTFDNALWHKRYLSLLQRALNQVAVRNSHMTIDSKDKRTIEPGSHYSQGGGGGGFASFGGLTIFGMGRGRGSLLLRVISGHNFLTSLSEVYVTKIE